MSSSPSRPTPDDDPPLVDRIWGYIAYTEHYHGPEDGTVTIDRADPHALLADEILNEVFVSPRPLRSSMLRLQPPTDALAGVSHVGGHGGVCQYPQHPFCFTGWLLHLDLPGRHLVYRIGNYRPTGNCWEASWPD